MGNFTRLVPSLFKKFIRVNLLQRWVLRLEQGLVEKREQDIVKWFDSTLLVSSKETSLLQRRTQCASIQTVKPLLQVPNKVIERDYEGEPIFVFLGRLDYPPNQLSLVHFLESQIDQIIKEIPEVKLRIIGRDANSELLRLAEKHKNTINIEGFVEDLDSVFSKACAMLIPLTSGSGVKLKTLEAFSRGLPVISTSVGVEGIPVASAVNCIVENDFRQYPSLMASLLNINYNSQLSRKAHELFQSHYSEEKLYKEYDLIFVQRAKANKQPISKTDRHNC